MPNPTLKKIAGSLENCIDKMGTMSGHQAVLLSLIAEEIETPEQEALLFSLQSCNSAGFDWRVEADRLIEELKVYLESGEVDHV